MFPSDGWPDLLGNVALNLGVRPRAVAMPNFEDPSIYLDFFARARDLALLPYTRRRAPAAAARMSRGKRAWEWTQGQVGGGVRNPARFRDDLVGEIGAVFAQLFHCFRDCRLPLRLAPTVACELRETWSLESERWIPVNGWAMDSARTGRRAFREVAPRSTDSDRRRRSSELAIAKAVSGYHE